MKSLYSLLRFWGHKVLPGNIRHKVYLIPYWLHIHLFMRRMDPENTPLFKYIEIETINRCNGDCDFCPVNVKQPQRPFAKMKSSLFYKIINELSEVDYSGEVHLFSNNEPFLDERIYDFARYAHERIPKAFISIYTNGSIIELSDVKRIVPFLNLLVIDDYKPNIKRQNITNIKEWCSTNDPETKKVLVDRRDSSEVLSSRGGAAPNKKEGLLFGVGRGCIYPFRQLVIRPDGKCSLCCNDAMGKYTMGDTTKESLLEIWNSKKYIQVRKSMKLGGRKSLDLCKKCDTHFFDGT